MLKDGNLVGIIHMGDNKVIKNKIKKKIDHFLSLPNDIPEAAWKWNAQENHREKETSLYCKRMFILDGLCLTACGLVSYIWRKSLNCHDLLCIWTWVSEGKEGSSTDRLRLNTWIWARPLQVWGCSQGSMLGAPYAPVWRNSQSHRTQQNPDGEKLWWFPPRHTVLQLNADSPHWF